MKSLIPTWQKFNEEEGVVLRRTLYNLIFVAAVLLVVPIRAMAVSLPQPTIKVWVVDGLSDTTLYARPIGVPYTFRVRMDVVQPPAPQPVDIYFGVITPSGQYLSWVLDSNGYKLVPGMVPAVRNLTNTFDSHDNAAQDVMYVFSGAETPGTYLVVGWVVAAGSNPALGEGWIDADIKPLFFSIPPPAN